MDIEENPFPQICRKGRRIEETLFWDLSSKLFFLVRVLSWTWRVKHRGCHILVIVQKPWYFMFTSSDDAGGYAYDPILRKCRSQLFVCNPITRAAKRLQEPPGLKSDYSALALSVDRKSHCYTVAVVKSKQVPDDFLQWDLSIHVYDSETQTWVTSMAEVLTGWRGGDESVVCGGVLYCLIYSTRILGSSENRHGLIMYDLCRRSSHASLIRTCIPVPCSLTCGRLMNLNDKLVMVGGIGKPDRHDIIKGIGIWVLVDKEWREVSRMPHKFFQGFGELDDVFASSGTDDLIYIQSYGAPALLVFDMNQKQWKWAQKCPVTKRFPLQLFTGFCFEPRLELAP
ncbi:hypothetical protein MRB53_030205 [Persea americana]|uniref:Uncharacterized protein n=1 Tax=Persea americana TaxID=3435 RepID=A0ACC2KKM7_PERAE|nr:hypothetical protein MRB53_030205 [Persea americana]